MQRQHSDPKVDALLKLMAHLDDLKSRKAVYLENYKAEVKATEQKIKDAKADLLGQRDPVEAQLWVSDTIRRVK